jgi:hypothetical protein
VTNLCRLRSDRERVRMKAGREGGWERVKMKAGREGGWERVRRGDREKMK